MVKKYVIYRVPLEADKGFKDKKEKIEKDIEKWTGKRRSIPMTRILTAIAINPVELGEDTIFKMVKKKKIKKIRSVFI